MKQRLASILNHRSLAAPLALLGVDIVFFSTTNPNRVPSALLIVGFLLVALSIYALLRLVLAIGSVYGLPVQGRGRRPALFLGVCAAVMLALQSLGELSLRDVIVLALLGLIAYVYTGYGRDSRVNK